MGNRSQKHLLYILDNSVEVSLQNVFLFQELTIHLVSLGSPEE